MACQQEIGSGTVAPSVQMEWRIVRGVSCVLLGSTQAALIGNFTPISRRPAKCAMTSPWIHSGARSAPLCIQGAFMARFAGQREIGVTFPRRAASVDPKSTQHTPLTKQNHRKKCFRIRPQTDFIRQVSSKLMLRGGSLPPGRPF